MYSFKKQIGEKERILFDTNLEYKALLKRLNKLISKVNFPSYVYSGVPNKDFLGNADSHRDNLYIQKADIKNFFPSTNDSYVYGLFLNKFNVSPDIAKILTIMTTCNLHGRSSRHIPQGFPTSTTLSFLAYFDMFNGIKKICDKNDIHFTLFVDDMTFSSPKRIPASFLKHISKVVSKYDLELHPQKIKRNNPYSAINVTGVNINPKNDLLKAPNKLQQKMFVNFQRVSDYSLRSYDDYLQFKKLVLKTEGQLNSIKRIEQERQMPYISKVISDIKDKFLVSSVKGASEDILIKEYKLFRERI
ncbi:reverse transcriptase family protein [Bacillus sp. SCS-153A]|uniref:reverse transcriptase family protein n=1 Tax=Rossellomorea sedimentorum TaxID=3115294 RepID=UPI003906AEBD